jgi:hypothetical protein
MGYCQKLETEVSLGWQHKYRGLMQHSDLQNSDHPLEQSSEQLFDRLRALTADRGRLAVQIGEVVKQSRAEMRVRMGKMSSQLGGPAFVLSDPVRFSSAAIDSSTSRHSGGWARLLRRGNKKLRKLVAG